MFEDYLQDSFEFLSEAERLVREAKEREAKRYFRAAVFYASAAMEAFVNYLADSFAKGQSIPEHEILYLNDSALAFAKSKGFVTKTEFHPLDNKLRLLISRFLPKFDFEGLAWNHFMEFKSMRDALVHSRDAEDERGLAEYRTKVRGGLNAIIQIMNEMMQGIFGKPLRKQILDLMPE